MRTRPYSCIRLLIALAALCAAATVSYGQKRFYIAPDDHTDYFWIADGDTYRQSFLTMIDYYLNKMDATAGDPTDQQMRWTCDGSLWMWEYEKNRTSAQFDRFADRVRDGHMNVALNALVLTQGGAPAEAVLRGMYYPGLVERREDIRFPVVMAMENQTLAYGLPSLWAGSGAKYSWNGVCNCASEVTGLNARDREIYYCGGRDGSRVLMKWNSQFVSNRHLGGYAEAFDPLATIGFAETDANFQKRYPFPVVGAFGRGWDDLQYTSDEFITIARKNSTPNRRIIVSSQIDFFRDFEQNYGAGLETFAASYGNEWDTLVASMAEVSARVKRATEKLRAAEAMATLVAVQDPAFMSSHVAQRDKAMLDLGLYFEHDWTADGPVPRSVRANWSRSVEAEITAYADKLYEDARAALAARISRSGAEQRFFVFNPLSWARTDIADIPLKANGAVKAVDVATGAELPSQVVRYGTQRFLRVLARNVPSLGYRVIELRPGAPATLPNAASSTGNSLETIQYRVTVAPDGAITSLIDKARGGRELARNISGRAVNDLGGDRSGSVVVENAGPVSVTLRAESSSPIRHVTRVTLFSEIPRIDIKNEILGNFGDVKTWSYSFNVDSPDVWHEEVGAVIRAKLLAAGGHYSPRNARYDWLTLNHFADVTNSQTGNSGITLSNADAYFMKLGASTASALDTATPQINALAGGQVLGPGLGIPVQGGDNYFMQRFALQPHGQFSQADAMKFALEHQNPLVTGSISGVGDQVRPYPEGTFSFLNISDPGVLLWALKPAEDGIDRGIIARVWNQSDSPASYNLQLALPITGAEKVTHIETYIENATVAGGRLSAVANQQQIQTHLLRIR